MTVINHLFYAIPDLDERLEARSDLNRQGFNLTLLESVRRSHKDLSGYQRDGLFHQIKIYFDSAEEDSEDYEERQKSQISKILEVPQMEIKKTKSFLKEKTSLTEEYSALIHLKNEKLDRLNQQLSQALEKIKSLEAEIQKLQEKPNLVNEPSQTKPSLNEPSQTKSPSNELSQTSSNHSELTKTEARSEKPSQIVAKPNPGKETIPTLKIPESVDPDSKVKYNFKTLTLHRPGLSGFLSGLITPHRKEAQKHEQDDTSLLDAVPEAPPMAIPDAPPDAPPLISTDVPPPAPAIPAAPSSELIARKPAQKRLGIPVFKQTVC